MSLTLVNEPLTFVRDPRHPCWGFPAFPDFVTEFYDHQWQAFLDIVAAYNAGSKVVLLDAPVGTGKTVIAEMVRRWRAKRSAYVCSDKALQDQFMRDFSYAALLKGRANYATADHPELLNPARWEDAVNAGDCDRTTMTLPGCDSCPKGDYDDEERAHCSECHPVLSCPYEAAKSHAIMSPLICVNTSYFLAEGNSGGKVCGHRAFVVIDECDLIEQEMMGFIEVAISSARRTKYGIDYPARKTAAAGEQYHWPEWFARTISDLRKQRRRHPVRPTTRDQRREVRYIDRLIGNLEMVQGTITDDGLTGWVYDGYDRGNIVFKPVMVDEFGPTHLWNHADEWLLMSGTIIDPTEMVTSLGIPDTKPWTVVTVPMTFPRENRPVHVIPVAEMSRKNKDEAWPLMLDKINEIAVLHGNDRILVHAVSYALAEFLAGGLPRDRVITYGASTERAAALSAYLSQPGAILVAPSMDRGVDLPGDACRVQVICKLPFPYLGDKQIQTRLYATRGGQQWYVVQCIRSFVQMTGRGVRNKDDHAVTYILDKAFQNNIWKKGKHLLPKYLIDAIDWSGRLPRAD